MRVLFSCADRESLPFPMTKATRLIETTCSVFQILFLLGLKTVALALMLWWQALTIGITILMLPIRMFIDFCKSLPFSNVQSILMVIVFVLSNLL